MLTYLHNMSKLRDHPAFVVYGLPAWPPVWVHTRTKPFKRLEGEIGIFTGTVLNDGIPSALFLKMQYEEEAYMGFLTVGDPAFCLELSRFLQSFIGRPINQIGDLDVSFLE